MTNTPLLPAEAALLVDPSASSAGKCIQAALVTLLGRDHIMISETRGFFSANRTLRLMPGDGERLPPHLAVLKNAIASGRGSVFRSQEVAKALRNAFGSDYRRYIHDHLARELIDRGLLVPEDRQWLGLIPYIHYRRTALGEAQAARIKRLVDELGGMRRLIRNDPDRAVQLARAAGVLLVLSPAARHQLPKLKALVERQGDGSSTAPIFDSDDSSSGWEYSVDFGDFSFAASAADLFDGIGAVGDFTGGDGGGDGGDGGGGGD